MKAGDPWLRILAFGQDHPWQLGGIVAILIGVAFGLAAAQTEPIEVALIVALLLGSAGFVIFGVWIRLARRRGFSDERRGPSWQGRPVIWRGVWALVSGFVVFAVEKLSGRTTKTAALLGLGVVVFIGLLSLLTMGLRRRH